MSLSILREESATAAIKVVSAFLLLAWGFELRAASGSVSDYCPIPLQQGNRWVYEGKVEWTIPGSGVVESAKIQWTNEIVELFKGSNALAAAVRGFPVELGGYEPGRSPGYCVLLVLSNRVYSLRSDGESQAKSLARQCSVNPGTLAQGGEELLEWPLAVGRKSGQDPLREDDWYCWCVEQVRDGALPVRGFARSRSQKTYRLAYRTGPDHQMLDVMPGLGIVRYVYSHHGTVASTEMRLISFTAPGASSTLRRPSASSGALK
jgi:hypothetical protein